MKDNFRNKRVLVMGFGLHGWGPGVVNWLLKHGSKVTVTDLKSAAELEPMLKKIDRSKVKLVLGRHRESDFKNIDILLQNPGVPRESKYLKIAADAGAVIENDASIFIKNCPGTVIGVTGTRGKSTTTALIHEILMKSDNRNQRSVRLAGLPQMPLLGILDKIRADDVAVLELSSWQLEILGRQRISPQVAVFTNIYPDHLNRYRGMGDYIGAKKNIFLYQNKDGICILNRDNRDTFKLGRLVNGRRYWFSKKYFAEENGCYASKGVIHFRENGRTEKVGAVGEIRLVGGHNLENVLAAVCVAKIFGTSNRRIVRVLQDFSGLPSRIELVREVKGIKYINDTTATTPDGTIAALKALKGRIVLIAGGETKAIPAAKYRELAELIRKRCRAVVLFSGRGSDQIRPYLKHFPVLVSGIGNMADAVAVARSLARFGDTILLSPACASFNLFVNEYDRGDQFNRAVKSL